MHACSQEYTTNTVHFYNIQVARHASEDHPMEFSCIECQCIKLLRLPALLFRPGTEKPRSTRSAPIRARSNMTSCSSLCAVKISMRTVSLNPWQKPVRLVRL